MTGTVPAGGTPAAGRPGEADGGDCGSRVGWHREAMAHSPRPVVALDVDGVLNALAPAPGAGGVPHTVTVPAGALPNSPFLAGGGLRDLTATIHLHPAHGEWIRRLLERADVWWATTWEGAANTHLAPLLGIDPLPVLNLRAGVPFGIARDRDSAAAKAWALTDLAEETGAPVVWVDDGNLRWAGTTWLAGRGLAVPVAPDAGLTATHRSAVEEFLGWAVTATPQDRFSLGDDVPGGSWTVGTDTGHRLELTSSGPPWAPTTVRRTWHRPDGSSVELGEVTLVECRIGAPLRMHARLPDDRPTGSPTGVVTELTGMPADED